MEHETEEAEKRGEERGKIIGEESGKKTEKIKIVAKLKEKGINVPEIAEIIGLSEKEIENL